MAEVPRETSAPPEALAVFGDRLDLAEQYADLLGTEGLLRGLIGPREAPRLWTRHLLNCAVVADLVPPSATVCDLGSGAGLPGLVLAIRRPDLQVTLVEPLLRRVTFLEDVTAALGLGSVRVVRARAEQLHGRHRFDVVTARAVAPLDRLLPWAMPLVSAGGALLAMKGAQAQDEVTASRAVWRRLGGAVPEVVQVAVPGGLPTHVVRLRTGSGG